MLKDILYQTTVWLYSNYSRAVAAGTSNFLKTRSWQLTFLFCVLYHLIRLRQGERTALRFEHEQVIVKCRTMIEFECRRSRLLVSALQATGRLLESRQLRTQAIEKT